MIMWSMVGAALRAKAMALNVHKATQQANAGRCNSTTDRKQSFSLPSVDSPRPSNVPSLRFSWNPLGVQSKRLPSTTPGTDDGAERTTKPNMQLPPIDVDASSDSDGAPEGDELYRGDGISEDKAEGTHESESQEAKRGTRRRCSYGASGFSSASRIEEEREARAYAAANRTKRPSHEKYTRDQLKPELLSALITGTHRCKFQWVDERGDTVLCNHELWDRLVPQALKALTDQRASFLSLSRAARARTVFEALTFETSGDLHHSPTQPSAASSRWSSPIKAVLYRVGPSADRFRLVCREVFLQNYPISLATLKRITALKRANGSLDYEAASKAAVLRGELSTTKSLEVIAWWLSYANQTSEKLPDVDLMLTPHRYLRDIYEEYANDMKAAGAAEHIVSPTWFGHVFRIAPELSHIAIASGKENFGRCTVCGDLECALRAARQRGDAQMLADKKQERLDHLRLERADKLAYYGHRKLAQDKAATSISCIIDKMDGNKNRCPSFARNPKKAHEELKEAMTLHIVGLIFHQHQGDVPHLFPAAPHLAGDSNLNCECFVRAARHQYGQTGMLPTLHVQLDNASDNKSRWVIAFFGWMVKKGYVKEVRLSMMTVGHTHEDIDAVFRRVSEYWSRQRYVLTPYSFLQYLGTAIPGSMVHPLVTYVHDFKAFFSDSVYDSVEGITEARVFIIKERPDGAIAFWYKPNAAHKHLYPAQKDEHGQPIKTTVNGEESYVVCPDGIEVFNTREGPAGDPPIAQFARDTNDSSKIRFDPEASSANVKKIIEALPERFSAADIAQWDLFFDNYPATVDDIPAEDIDILSGDWLPKCSMRMPDAAGAARQQAIYAECIRYINPISGTGASRQSLGIARADEKDVPILQEGALVCILPNQQELATGNLALGDRIPFYLGQVQEDEDAPIDSHGRRIENIKDDDEFVIQWLSNIDSRGRILNSVTGAWKPRCTHFNNRGAAHEWDSQLCARAPHAKFLHTITRDAILIYDVALTSSGKVEASSKMQICRALLSFPESLKLLPDTWRPTRAPKRKRISRRR